MSPTARTNPTALAASQNTSHQDSYMMTTIPDSVTSLAV